MRKILPIIATFFAICLASSCSKTPDVRQRAQEVAAATVGFACPDNDNYHIVEVSNADTVMGARFVDDDEFNVLAVMMQDVSNKIIERTENLTKIDTTDLYLINIANLQMYARQNLQNINTRKSFTDGFSGWRVRVFYEVPLEQGDTIKVVRYCILTADGNAVMTIYDFPMI